MGMLISLLVNTVAVLITAYLLQSGVRVENFQTAVVVAIVLAIVNTFIKPIVHLLTFPITFITLGLFTLVINGLMILLVSALVSGFQVNGFLWAVLFSLVLSVVNSILQTFTK